MKTTRREFAALGMGGLAAVLGPGGLLAAAPAMAKGEAPPWYRTVKRLGQTNFNERDPEHGDVEAWADYWSSVGVQAVILSVSGPVAFYPTRVPYFHASKYLNGRDLFGDCVAAAKKRGMRVVGRMSPDIQYTDPALLAAHPQWFRRDQAGHLQAPAPDIAFTCQFSGQFTEQQPAILRELNARYDIDGVYMNGWPTLQRCYCDTCRKLGDPMSAKYRATVMEDAERLVDRYRGIILEKSRNNFYSCNIAGGIDETEVDLWKLTRNALWFTSDNQARGQVDPVWQAAQQVKFAHALMGDRPVAAVSAGYTRSGATWRQVSNTTAEPVTRMAQTAAAGGIVWYHQLGLQQGFAEDRRWQKNGRDFLSWMAANDRHFVNRRSLANVALVVPATTMAHYRLDRHDERIDYLQGMYALLNQARIPFDLVHENDLGAARLKPYDLLILPNFAFMSDAQAAALRAYAKAGGSLLATFETGLYDEAGRARTDFALADLFGIAKAGPATSHAPSSAPMSFFSSITLQKLGRPAALTEGFDDTTWIAGPASVQPIRSSANAVMTFIDPYPVYPPEAVYQRKVPSDLPSQVVREQGGARLAYLAGDMDRTFWLSDNQDLARQMTNTIRWLLRDRLSVSVTGEGLAEVIGWVTEPGYAVHILNYNSPNAFRGFTKPPVAIGEQLVRINLPDDKPVRRAALLWAKQEIPLRQSGRTVELSVPKVELYEVVALEV